MAHTSLTITFLGTGTSSGVPMIVCGCEVCTSHDVKDKRLRSSILVQSASTTFIVDTTPDFRQQMLRINNKHLDAVLFTHPHKDHIAGLDDIRAYNFFSGKPMKVYANELTIKALEKEFEYAFSEKRYPGTPEIELHKISEQPFSIEDVPVLPVPVWHHKMPVFGYRFGDFTYITDANRIDEKSKQLIKGSKIIVVNALRKENHISHFTLAEAIALIDELEIPEAYLTHISHQLGKHEAVTKILPVHIHLAYDNLVLQL